MLPQQKWGQSSFRGHFRSLIRNGQVVCNWSLYPHTLMNFHGTWTKGYLGMSTHVNKEKSKVNQLDVGNKKDQYNNSGSNNPRTSKKQRKQNQVTNN